MDELTISGPTHELDEVYFLTVAPEYKTQTLSSTDRVSGATADLDSNSSAGFSVNLSNYTRSEFFSFIYAQVNLNVHKLEFDQPDTELLIENPVQTLMDINSMLAWGRDFKLQHSIGYKQLLAIQRSSAEFIGFAEYGVFYVGAGPLYQSSIDKKINFETYLMANYQFPSTIKGDFKSEGGLGYLSSLKVTFNLKSVFISAQMKQEGVFQKTNDSEAKLTETSVNLGLTLML
jgi:hypothetical protein